MFSNLPAGIACQRELQEYSVDNAAHEKPAFLTKLFATTDGLNKAMGCAWRVRGEAELELELETTVPLRQSQHQPHLELQVKEPRILSGLLRNRSSCATTATATVTITAQTMMGYKDDSRHRAGQRSTWIDSDSSKNSNQDDLLDNTDTETINRSNSLVSDSTHSSKSISSGSTLIGSTDNGTSLDPDAEQAGYGNSRTRPPDRAQPIGSMCQPSLIRRCLGTRKRSNPPVLVFVLRQHPRFAGVLEVIDCDDMVVAYRKIVRETQRPWRETFHEVIVQPDNLASASASASISTSTSASFLQRRDSMRAGQTSSSRYAAGGGPLSFATSASSVSSSRSSSSSSSSRSSSSSSAREWTGCRLPFQTASWKQALGRHPHAFDASQLWEISSPNPDMFPMHCRDARGVIDPVPLASMVLDRHQFCFRFQLCGNKMRWQVASKEECGRRMQLQCFVRSTVVALLFFTITAQQQQQQQPDDGLAHGPAISTCSTAENSLHRLSLWNRSANRVCAPTMPAAPTDSAKRPTLPSVVILPTAFGKLPDLDAAVVESFVLFTGIEVLERFVAAG